MFSKGRQFFEDVLVDPGTRGIRNAVVWLRPDDDDRDAPFPADKIWPGRRKPAAASHTIETGCCQFTPRVVVARAGDRLRFVNRAPVAHNVHYTPAGGWGGTPRGFNVLLPAGGEHAGDKPLPAHRGADDFRCDIHPWMKGYVWTFDHPYAVVTAADGRFTIPVAPVGAWRLVVWHEKTGPVGSKGAVRKVVVKDGPDGTDFGTIPLESPAWDEQKVKE